MQRGGTVKIVVHYAFTPAQIDAFRDLANRLGGHEVVHVETHSQRITAPEGQFLDIALHGRDRCVVIEVMEVAGEIHPANGADGHARTSPCTRGKSAIIEPASPQKLAHAVEIGRASWRERV